MQAVASRRPAEAGQSDPLKPIPDFESSRDNVRECHTLSGVKVKHDAVRAPSIRFGRSPWMELDGGYLRQRDDPLISSLAR